MQISAIFQGKVITVEDGKLSEVNTGSEEKER